MLALIRNNVAGSRGRKFIVVLCSAPAMPDPSIRPLVRRHYVSYPSHLPPCTQEKTIGQGLWRPAATGAMNKERKSDLNKPSFTRSSFLHVTLCNTTCTSSDLKKIIHWQGIQLLKWSTVKLVKLPSNCWPWFKACDLYLMNHMEPRFRSRTINRS